MRELRLRKRDVFEVKNGSMPNVCDLCNAMESDDGFIFLTRDMRLAVRGGLDLDKVLPFKESGVIDKFLMLLEADETDWKLCSSCASATRLCIIRFWEVIKLRHREWVGQVSSSLGASCWEGYVQDRAGFLEVLVPQFNDITGTYTYPSRYVPASSADDEHFTDDVRRMCEVYDPELECVVVFSYLSISESVETAHSIRFQPPVSPPEAFEIRREYSEKRVMDKSDAI